MKPVALLYATRAVGFEGVTVTLIDWANAPAHTSAPGGAGSWVAKTVMVCVGCWTVDVPWDTRLAVRGCGTERA